MIACKLLVAGLGAACVAVVAGGGSPSASLSGLGLDVSARIQAIGGHSEAAGTAGQQLHDVVDVMRTLRTKLETIGSA